MPASSAQIAGHIQGLRELKAKFQALPAIVRDHMNDANEITVQEIQRHARARLEASPSIQTRALYHAVGYRVTRTNGTARVGITTARTGQQFPARYAHLVERGRAHAKAEPFMGPAVESQRGPYVARCKAAKAGIVRDLSTVGGGVL